MSLHKLARELDETARQTAAMVGGIAEALELLSDKTMNREQAARDAIQMIVTALQGQDRIEQRCHNLASAVRQFAVLPAATPEAVYDEIWAGLTLDELRVPALSGIAAHVSQGDAEIGIASRLSPHPDQTGPSARCPGKIPTAQPCSVVKAHLLDQPGRYTGC
jgi:hypothetical protein